MQDLFAAALLHPQLQPCVIASAASLHKLYGSKGKSSQLHLMHATAEAARHIILDLNRKGGPCMTGHRSVPMCRPPSCSGIACHARLHRNMDSC
jgi:hypothetical protein